MLTYHRKLVNLSFSSIDLPIWSTTESMAYLYQKDRDKFHLLLRQQNESSSNFTIDDNRYSETSDCALFKQPSARKELIWLEISPYKIVMTMQGKGKLSYRHFWEESLNGVSRYSLNGDSSDRTMSFRLRNFTRSLYLETNPLPKKLKIEYELWTEKVQLGVYLLQLDIYH
jgi:hypothetical protein